MFVLSIAQSTHTSNNGALPTVKKVQKNFNNYASVECGAKILGANPEAKVLYYILLRNPLTLSDVDTMTDTNSYLFVNLFHTEHFSHIEGEHGPVHAKPL